MASYKGFVRLPPIGELGQKDDGKSMEKLDSIASPRILTLKEPISKSAEGSRTRINKEVNDNERLPTKHNKKDLEVNEQKVNVSDSKKEKLVDSSDKMELKKRMDLFSRDSGLDVDSANDSMDTRDSIFQDKKEKHKRNKKKQGRMHLEMFPAASSVAETKVDISSNTGIDDSHNTDNKIFLGSKRVSVVKPIPAVDNFNKIPSMSSSEMDRVDYRELAIRMANNYNKPTVERRKRKFVDYVLVYDANDTSDMNCVQRKAFQNALANEKISVTETPIGRHIFVELCCSFERLCQEAESIFLEMPLVGLSLQKDDSVNNSKWKSFQSEREVDDICIPFCNTTKEIYDGVNHPDKFFRPALRSLLVHQILKYIKTNCSDDTKGENVEALASLLHNGIYEDAFILHERSSLDPSFPLNPYRKKSIGYPSDGEREVTDRRRELHVTWLASFKFQPLWKVRNYFGEQIALYFAWLGVLITSLWIPMFIGFIVFFYGVAKVFISNELQSWSKVAFDNDLTPFFALIICLWGTIFLEVWKRKNAELAYKWDVDGFEDQEPNRPQFYGTEKVMNPLTHKLEPYYSPLKKTAKSMGSMVLIFFMVILVVGSMVSVILYRVISRVDWFSGTYKDLKSNITSSILNSASIMLLGFVYKHLAKKLTDWENHCTQTQYDDSLILKLFGFQFVNSYSSLYYIAFFRERTKDGVLGKGVLYTDACGVENNCMSLLSLQVGTLMLMKPMPKLFTDIGLPLLRKAYRSIQRSVRGNKILDSRTVINENLDSDIEFEDYMNHERKKPSVGDFTLGEYTEKVIQYGYLMLFAAAFPLAPLIALLTNLIDLRIDARRLLWLNRRPVSRRAQDIGMWYTILKLLNYVGVVTNAFVISLTSSFGRKYKTETTTSLSWNTTTANATTGNSTINYNTTNMVVTSFENLWIIIIFENVVLAVRFILAYAIPDIPEKVRTAQKKECLEVEAVLQKVGMRRGKKKTIAPAISSWPKTGESQLDISFKSKEGGGKLKEKIKRISEVHRRSRKKPKGEHDHQKRTKTFLVDANNDKNKSSEV